MGPNDDTISAVATGRGGAIAVIRTSGSRAVDIADGMFVSRNGTSLLQAAGYTVHFGEIRDGDEIVDEVLVSVFRAPHSYTGEDSVEISCHGSPYIENRIMQLLVEAGSRVAAPGEFTMRAFLAGKMDLSQAEAVADLISSSDRARHSLAMGQLRGGVSSALAVLRAELVTLASLLELELDFGEEDVEFASRTRLEKLTRAVAAELDILAGSFALGNAIRGGVPVAIVGRPNAGKSTLLNALAGDDRAMVSEIAGTTRDRIEEQVNLGGVTFRLIDTAGLRATDDVLERMGIDRAMDAVRSAYIVLLVVDAGDSADDFAARITALNLREDQRLFVVFNKIDAVSAERIDRLLPEEVESVAVSAKTGENLDMLKDMLSGAVDVSVIGADSAVISGARHYEALTLARAAVQRVLGGLGVRDGHDDNVDRGAEGAAAYPMVSADLLAEDIRQVLHHLGSITGEVTSSEILSTIFSRFCIGK